MKSNSNLNIIRSIVSLLAIVPWLFVSETPLKAEAIHKLIDRGGSERLIISDSEEGSLLDNSSINGLFVPNSSELFFREGRENFDLEIDMLLDNRLSVSEDLLEIQDEIFQQQQELEKNPQLDITPDSIELQ